MKCSSGGYYWYGKNMLVASVWADYSSVLHVKLIHIRLVLCMAFNMKPGRDTPVHLVSKPLYERVSLSDKDQYKLTSA